MSIAVDVADLAALTADRQWCYLLSVGPDLRAHAVAAPIHLEAGRFRVEVGARTRANVVARPEVTLLFPPVEPGGMTLIVDGAAVGDGGAVVVGPHSAVWHRAASGASAAVTPDAAADGG